jgi:hypothetical protein
VQETKDDPVTIQRIDCFRLSHGVGAERVWSGIIADTRINANNRAHDHTHSSAHVNASTAADPCTHTDFHFRSL